MKILVIGASGQVGSELGSALARIADQKGEYPQVLLSDRGDMDLTQLPKISEHLNLIAPDIIVNASAYTAVDKAESQSELAFLINEAAVKEMAHYCKRNGCSLLHISTDYVFDGQGEKAYIETDSVGPSSVYGCSKLAGENLIRELLTDHIILRTSWVFSKNRTNFVKTMLRLAKEKKELNVVGDQFGAPTSARGIAEVIGHIIITISNPSKGAPAWGTYHYSGQPYVSWADFALEIFEQAVDKDLIQASPKVNPISSAAYPTPANRPANSRLDCGKLKNRFGIKPDDWKRSLGLVLDELKEGIKN